MLQIILYSYTRGWNEAMMVTCSAPLCTKWSHQASHKVLTPITTDTCSVSPSENIQMVTLTENKEAVNSHLLGH